MKRWWEWIRVRHSFLFRAFLQNFLARKQTKKGSNWRLHPPKRCETTTLRTSANHGCPRNLGSFLVVTSYLYFRRLRVIHPPVKMITPSGPSRPLNKPSFEKKTTKLLVRIYFINNPHGCFLKWWYPQNTLKWSFLVGRPWLLGTTILGTPHRLHGIGIFGMFTYIFQA